MARHKIIPDLAVFAEIRRLLAGGGDKAVSFASVSQATGLAAPTLVQRFGSRDKMVESALLAAWETLHAQTAAAASDAPLSPKGAHAFLKAIGADAPEAAEMSLLAADFRNPTLRIRAADWRDQVETALAVRLGGGDKGRDAAAILFAAWQGQMLWQPAGGKSFKIKDVLKKHGG